MAEIEIVYRSSGRCVLMMPDYCMQCHTCYAGDMGCKAYLAEGAGNVNEHGLMIIPFGNCSRAKFKYSRKGWVGKKYEIGEVNEDPYNLHLECIPVALGNTLYEQCVKVTLNGKVIYNNYDEEEVSGDESL